MIFLIPIFLLHPLHPLYSRKVSTSLTGNPFIFIISSIESLVVPGILVTIALWSSKSAFRSDDFPTLGLPTIATKMHL